MESVLRAAAVYFFLLLIFRLVGKRTLSEVTTFDFVLLLIIGEATQQALLRDDRSVTNCFVVIISLITIEVVLALLKQRSPRLRTLLDGRPIVILSRGRPLKRRMRRELVNENDILAAARRTCGLARLDQIEHATLEAHGSISIMPRRAAPASEKGPEGPPETN